MKSLTTTLVKSKSLNECKQMDIGTFEKQQYCNIFNIMILQFCLT